jgi:hypothetical protein
VRQDIEPIEPMAETRHAAREQMSPQAERELSDPECDAKRYKGGHLGLQNIGLAPIDHASSKARIPYAVLTLGCSRCADPGPIPHNCFDQ